MPQNTHIFLAAATSTSRLALAAVIFDPDPDIRANASAILHEFGEVTDDWIAT